MTRVLLVRLSAMGDVVQCLGATRALAEARPDLELHFVVQDRFLPLLEGEDYLASRIVFDRFGGLMAVWRLRRELKRLRFDVALDLQGNWKSALVCWLSGAKERIGAQKEHRREPSSAWLLNHQVGWLGPSHPAKMAWAVADTLAPGLKVEGPELRPREVAVEAATRDLAAVGLDPHQPFTVFVVTAPGDPRTWHRSAMGRQLEQEVHPVVFLLGPDVLPVGLPADARVISHGPEQLPELVALGHLVSRAQGRVLGPDRGPTHVLCAAGARTQVLCGPTDPQRTAPPGAEPLRREDGPACVPCQKRTCSYTEGPVCMDFCASEAVAARSV